jgi:hypothetical protein
METETTELLDREDEKLKQQVKAEFKAVQDLGDKIGYGNLMSIAFSVWRKKLEELDGP